MIQQSRLFADDKFTMLEDLACRIEDVLQYCECPARIMGGLVLPRVIRFQSSLSDFTPTQHRIAEREIAARLERPVRIMFEGEIALIEVKRTEPQPVILDDLLRRLPAVPFGTVVLGIADDGAPLLLRLSAPDVQHALITGASGCGKTSLLRAMAFSLVLQHRPREVRLMLAGDSLSDLRLYPHSDEMSLPLLTNTLSMRQRRGEHSPLIVLVVDNLTWSMVLRRYGARALRDFADILRFGPGVGIHVIAAGSELLTDLSWPVRLIGAGEPGYFTAESRTGAANFTAARVNHERCSWPAQSAGQEG